ncbi:MAG: Glu-tRNA(Gln) amidotransferase subunit GatE [Candidatus Aenigmarchaeota archaeon]|nr:Glu-tRNA(Gln) amidotransferase subunit GatE [Candidatus Aenigmarchaeota archaeon]
MGLELHQQLNTKKLFCNCSSEMKEKRLIYEAKRKLRPVVSELGKFDRTVLFEFFKNKEFIYHGYENEACLVELDEEPPHRVNKDALEIALSVALLLGLKIPEEIWVMRKTVLDGSAITSFQRTALIGIGPSTFHAIRIASLCLEEDAAKVEKREGHKVFYSLSRLGIPLIEIATEPDIRSPQQAKIFAEELGLLLRTFNVKRGIGTVRQDVNVSIMGGARVEIKGWQELGSIDKLIENEVRRQLSLIEIKNTLRKLNAKVDKPIEVSKFLGMNIKTFLIVLRNFRTVWNKKVYGENYNKTLKDEIFEYATVYNSFAVDDEESELRKEFDILKNRFNGTENDVFVLIYGGEYERAAQSIYERSSFCLKRVPKETRKPNPDTTTSFSRPLPGSARMYPETDHPPIKIDRKHLQNLKKKLPKPLNERKKELENIIPKEIASQIVRSRYFMLFDEVVRGSKNSEFIKVVAITLTSTLKELKRDGLDINKITHKDLVTIFESFRMREISKKAIPNILKLVIEGIDVRDAIRKFKKISKSELRKIVKEIYEKNKDIPFSKLLGLVMREIGGKAEAKEVVEELKKLM